MSFKCKYRARDSAFAKVSAFFLAFLLLLPPLAPVLADDAVTTPPPADETSTASTPPADSSVSSAPSTPTLAPTPLPSTPSVAPASTPSGSGAGIETIPTTLAPVASKKVVPNVDQTTGALNYSYPLEVPTGRNSLSPELKLAYNSQNLSESEVGYGWSLPIAFISRANKHGTDQLYTGTYQDFTSSLDGDLVQVTSAHTTDADEGTYAAKSDSGNFLSYTYSGGIWSVKDKNGTMYSFGETADSRQDDVANPSHVYKWMLDQTRDANDNFITYTYYKDAGQIYPDTIGYTGNGTASGLYQIQFNHEAQIGVLANDSAGFKVGTNYRISKMTINASGTAVKEYHFIYGFGQNGVRSTLDGVTAKDISIGTSLPTTFSGWGAVNAPETLGMSSALAYSATVGGIAGTAGDAAKQYVDSQTGAQKGGFNSKEFGVSVGFGTIAAGLTEGVLPEANIDGLSSGRGNMNSVSKGLSTKLENGTISNVSVGSGFKSAIGSQSSGIYKTLGGIGLDFANPQSKK